MPPPYESVTRLTSRLAAPETYLAQARCGLIRHSTRLPRAMPSELKQLLAGLDVVAFSGDMKVPVTGLTNDSRRVRRGDVFFALTGARTDGHRFISEAIDRGACAVISDQPGRVTGATAHIQVRQLRRGMAEVARRFYDEPQRALKLTAVTGTNGKTTVSCLLQHLLGRSTTGLIGTVHYDLGGRTLPAARTTPESLDLAALLAQMRDQHCTHAVMETSSHGLAQARVWGMPYHTAVFTNLTQDHLDYHGTMQEYFAAKASLFTGEGTGHAPRVAVINLDDSWGRQLIPLCPPTTRVLTYSLERPADFTVSSLTLTTEGSKFRLRHPEGESDVSTRLPGRYNVSNVLAALAAAYAQGLSMVDCLVRLAAFAGVPGRMERVEGGEGISVLVDYAHTDDALKNVLSNLRPITSGRIILVFGCGGDRDRRKRPLMTRAALEGADLCFATSDNPRFESLLQIFDDMRAGVAATDSSRISFIESRRRAISLALDAARPGDCLLIAGKGHETYQELADTVTPFDDRLVARELLDIKRSARGAGGNTTRLSTRQR